MSWKRIVAINALLTCVLVFLAEAAASVAWYQKDRPYYLHPSAAVSLVYGVLEKIRAYDPEAEPEKTKLEKVISLRAEVPGALPAYLFDPQFHADLSTIHLANPANATVVLCNEGSGWTVFDTDEVGFRNPKGQLGRDVDFLFLGDSYTEGACVDEEDTVAGVFRADGRTVMNIGRSGTGPLYQLAILREYGAAVQAPTMVWFIFAGNDLKNLREEKATSLIRYLEDDGYTQNLLARREEVSATLTAFLEDQIERGAERQRRSLPSPYKRPYGESLDIIEAERTDLALFVQVAEKILSVAERLGMRTQIVLINHPKSYYRQDIQKALRRTVVDLAGEAGVPLVELDRDELDREHTRLFASPGTHFAPEGYRWLAEKTSRALTAIESEDASPEREPEEASSERGDGDRYARKIVPSSS